MEKHPRITYLEHLVELQKTEISTLKEDLKTTKAHNRKLQASSLAHQSKRLQTEMENSQLNQELKRAIKANDTLTQRLNYRPSAQYRYVPIDSHRERSVLSDEIQQFMSTVDITLDNPQPLDQLFHRFTSSTTQPPTVVPTRIIFTRQLTKLGYVKRRERSNFTRDGRKIYMIYPPIPLSTPLSSPLTEELPEKSPTPRAPEIRAFNPDGLAMILAAQLRKLDLGIYPANEILELDERLSDLTTEQLFRTMKSSFMNVPFRYNKEDDTYELLEDTDE